ncbi:MAG TPA: isochorismatase family protein [Terriglobales bacterium]|nr:isochorismatase family protein [Terriglobales bacterium]
MALITPLQSAAQNDSARERLDPARAALVVIDIQEKLLPPIHEGERLLRNAALLLRLASILQLPVMATTQYAGGLGATVAPIADLLPAGTEIHDKLEFSCFGCAEFCDSIAQHSGREQLLICGMETHICVMQTALAALDRGYRVHVAADAVGSRSEFNWKTGLERLRDAGAVISSTEMAIYELLRASGGKAFKEMLPWLKA